jgi:hypothetical protein
VLVTWKLAGWAPLIVFAVTFLESLRGTSLLVPALTPVA